MHAHTPYYFETPFLFVRNNNCLGEQMMHPNLPYWIRQNKMKGDHFLLIGINFAFGELSFYSCAQLLPPTLAKAVMSLQPLADKRKKLPGLLS